ncbi:MAG TPA: NAD(+)--dinitrogen-reductase ADP-D-ribosyltransferase, partial [Hydrogenophaga sp.]
MRDDGSDQPHRWYSTNLVGIPTGLLSSTAFNAHPVALSIAGARASHPGLFSLLDRSADLNEAGEIFVHYLAITFGLRRPAAHEIGNLGP